MFFGVLLDFGKLKKVLRVNSHTLSLVPLKSKTPHLCNELSNDERKKAECCPKIDDTEIEATFFWRGTS